MRYQVTTKSGLDLGEVVAATAEDAVVAAYRAAGIDGEPVSVFDDQANVPALREFDDLASALKVFVPEAIATIEVIN